MVYRSLKNVSREKRLVDTATQIRPDLRSAPNFADDADDQHGNHAQIQGASRKFGMIRVTA
jgi:hypothetical protein